MIINRGSIEIVTTIIAALPAIQAQRPAFEKHLKTFDFAVLDGLEDAANTLRVAQSALTAVKPEIDELGPYFAECVAFRTLLVNDVNGLVKRGKLRETVLAELKGPPGYTNVAADFMVMVSHLRSNWEEASKKVPQEDLDKAQAMSDRLFYLAAQRDKADVALNEATLRRAQAYTLVVRSYEYVRAALTWVLFLEGKGNVNDIAPSLAVVKRAKTTPSDPPPAPSDEEKVDGLVGPDAVVISPDASHPQPASPRGEVMLGAVADPLL